MPRVGMDYELLGNAGGGGIVWCGAWRWWRGVVWRSMM